MIGTKWTLPDGLFPPNFVKAVRGIEQEFEQNKQNIDAAKPGSNEYWALVDKELDLHKKLCSVLDREMGNVLKRVDGRKTGMATGQEELRMWTIKKLLGEIRKQIRSDWGGLNREGAIQSILKRLHDLNIICDPAVGGFIYDLVQEKIAGCRNRVESKIAELERRLDCLVGNQ